MSNISFSVCRPCQLRLIGASSLRSFTTTTKRGVIPPESPEYIHVPQTLQPDLISPRRIRGTLPVPREVFPERQPEKLQSDFADRATRSRRKPLDLQSASELEKQKYRAAEMRKEHLREGLAELRARKTKIERQIAARSRAKQEERERLIAQAEREDERLMNASVLKGMLPTKGSQLPDPNAKERYEASVARVKARAAQRAEEKRDALHTLFMNARKFIITETALDNEIARVFPDSNDPAFQTPSGEGTNIWNTGVPPRVTELLKKTNAADDLNNLRRGADSGANPELARISAERVKKLAEELSGGKI